MSATKISLYYLPNTPNDENFENLLRPIFAAPGAGVKCRISYPIKTFHACLFEVVSLYLENLPRNPLDLNRLLRDELSKNLLEKSKTTVL